MISELDSASRQLDAELAGEASGPAWISMRILCGDKGPDTPLEDVSALKMGLKASCSVGLRYTHEDAAGWLNYLQTFLRRCKFWYRDRNVRIWAYYPPYDNTHGIGSVLTFYHSGPGSMTSDGRFCVRLGADWGGQGSIACSDKMVLGDGCLRYIFWSTCYSCRVLHGHNPIRRWSHANKGFRMLFGYETVSYDNPNYGSAFWKHWNKGKSFSTAFLDASCPARA